MEPIGFGPWMISKRTNRKKHGKQGQKSVKTRATTAPKSPDTEAVAGGFRFGPLAESKTTSLPGDTQTFAFGSKPMQSVTSHKVRNPTAGKNPQPKRGKEPSTESRVASQKQSKPNQAAKGPQLPKPNGKGIPHPTPVTTVDLKQLETRLKAALDKVVPYGMSGHQSDGGKATPSVAMQLCDQATSPWPRSQRVLQPWKELQWIPRKGRRRLNLMGHQVMLQQVL